MAEQYAHACVFGGDTSTEPDTTPKTYEECLIMRSETMCPLNDMELPQLPYHKSATFPNP